VKKAATKKKKAKEFQTPYTVTGALVKGNAITKLSMLIMGLGNIAHKQIVKGLMFLAIEVAYLYYMISYGFYAVSMLPSLGWREREKVWNDAKSIYEYQAGDNSQLILLYGVATLYITFIFIIVWREAVKSSYKSELLAKAGKHLNTFKEDFKSLFDQNLHTPTDGNFDLYCFAIDLQYFNGIYQLQYIWRTLSVIRLGWICYL